MTLLHYLSYAGAIATFLFVTLSLASGLLWLAELIEEHSKTAKTIGIRAIYTIITLHIALYLIDGLPLLLILFSIAAHLVYLQNFTNTWPFISLKSARFLGSCCMVVADHFLWFFYFAEKAQEAKRFNSSSRRFRQAAGGKAGPTFMDVAAFFAVCVWFVPLFLFLSLSANDNVLPRMDQAPGTPSGLGPHVDLSSSPRTLAALDTSNTYFSSPAPAGRTSLVKSLLAPVMSYMPGSARAGKRRQHDEGIIAPRTPLRGSPMPSPRLSAVNLSLPGQQTTTWDDSSASGSGYGTPLTHPSSAEGRGSLGLSAPASASINLRRGLSPKPSLNNLNTTSAPAAWPQGTWSPSAAGSPSRAPPRRTASGSVGSGSVGMKRTPSASGFAEAPPGQGAVVVDVPPRHEGVPAALSGAVGGDGAAVRRAAGKAKDD